MSKLAIEDCHQVNVVFDHDDYEKAHDARKDELEWVLDAYVPDGGYVLEFGVYEGKTISHMAKHRPNINFYGFDSFQGLPEDWDYGEKFIPAERFDVGGKLPKVPKNVTLIPGFFSETLVTTFFSHIFEIDFLNIDCDLYSSTKEILTALNRNITTKTILRFDELCEWRIPPFYTNEQVEADKRIPQKKYTNWRDGEWRALNEWMVEFDREVVPIARNYSQSCVFEVVK